MTPMSLLFGTVGNNKNVTGENVRNLIQQIKAKIDVQYIYCTLLFCVY
jgi:hypothetical protein